MILHLEKQALRLNEVYCGSTEALFWGSLPHTSWRKSRGVLLTAPAYGSCKFGAWLVPILFSKLPLPPAEMLIRTRVKPDKNKAGWVLWCVTARCNFSIVKKHDDRMSYSGIYMQGELITQTRDKLTELSSQKNQATRYWSSYTTLAVISKFLVPGPKSLCSCPEDIHFNTGGGKCLNHATRQPYLCLKKLSVSWRNKLPVSSDSSSSSSSSPDEGESRRRRRKTWSRKRTTHGDEAGWGCGCHSGLQ